jgi:glycerol-3-phosphate cytidylyltransferase-like family protein
LILPGFIFSLRLLEQLLSNLLKLLCRVAMVRAVKWVDEVIEAVPYEITEEFMNNLFKEYKIDYIIHGDDPCILPDGSDAYAHAKKAGRYKQIKRTEGVSSTDIVGMVCLLSPCSGPYDFAYEIS